MAATAVNFHDIFTRRGMPGVKIRLPVIVGSDIAGTVESRRRRCDAALAGRARAHRSGHARRGPRRHARGDGRRRTSGVRRGPRVDAGRNPPRSASSMRPLCRSLMAPPIACWLPVGRQGGRTGHGPRRERRRGRRLRAARPNGGRRGARFRRSHAPSSSGSKELGATHARNYLDRPFLDIVKEIYGKPRVNGSGGVDVAVNFTGGDTLPETQKCVKLNGRILCCGATAGFDLSLDARYWWTYEHTMIGSDGWLQEDLVDLARSGGRRPLSPVIDRGATSRADRSRGAACSRGARSSARCSSSRDEDAPALLNLGDMLRLPRMGERIALIDLREATRVADA